jgi:hypothetical protein
MSKRNHNFSFSNIEQIIFRIASIIFFILLLIKLLKIEINSL